MPVSKFIYLVFSVCFLFVLAEPTLVLLTSGHEELSITSSMEKEAENKDLDDTREFSELDFDKKKISEVCFFTALSSLTYGFSKQNIKALDKKNIFPPPDFI
jgi:hypothetical protein